MPEEKSKAVHCPNCQGPATRAGNKITCEKCDAIFRITKEGSATIQQLGPIEDHEERLKKIEAKIFIDEPEPAEPQGGEEDDEPETKPEPENSNADQNDEILPR